MFEKIKKIAVQSLWISKFAQLSDYYYVEKNYLLPFT